MFNSDYLLIPSALFWYIKHEHNLDSFPKLSKQRIGAKRYQKSRTPEQKEAFRETMRGIMHDVRVKYCANRTPAQKKAYSRRMSEMRYNFWKNMTPEEREIHIKKMSVGMSKAMKKRWKENPYGEKLRIHPYVIGKLEENIPRINTYSGVITESQMDELNA